MDGAEEYVDDPDETEEEESGCSSAKKRKSGKESQESKKSFQKKWLEDTEFKGWLKEVPNDETSARCLACGTVLHAGKSDLQKHAQTAKHVKAAKARESTQSLKDSFAKSTARKTFLKQHENDVETIEVQLSSFLAEHNVAYQTADHLIKVLKNGAKDSKIIQDLTLGRFKCSSIVRNVIAKVETEELVSILRENLFSVLIDESTDVANKKNMCVLVRFVSPTTGKIETRLLEMVELDAHDTSAAGLWGAFENCMTRNQVPIENILGLACDNAAVMTGVRDSFWTRLKARCPWAILLPCICHSSALITRHACATLPSFVEGVLRSVSSYLNCSPKRSAELKDFQELYEEEINRILKPSGTRWLVLHSCIVRFLSHYDSLTGFFRTAVREDPKDKEAQSILQDLNNPFLKAYLYFLSYVLNFFNEFNALFQENYVLIHKLAGCSNTLLKKLCQNFVVPEKLGDLSTLNFSHPSNKLPADKIYLGPACKTYLENMPLPVDNRKTQEQLKYDLENMKRQFVEKCTNFYVKAAEQMSSRLPLSKKIFKEMEFIDPRIILSHKARVDGSLQDLSALCSVFQERLQLDTNALAIEWRTVAVEIDDELKTELLAMAPYQAWVVVGKLKNYNDAPIFPQLTKLAKAVMALPHSNADAERSFSIVTDVKTKKRNRMGAENLNAIAVVRTAFSARGTDCFTFEVKKEHLDRFNQDIYKSSN